MQVHKLDHRLRSQLRDASSEPNGLGMHTPSSQEESAFSRLQPPTEVKIPTVASPQLWLWHPNPFHKQEPLSQPWLRIRILARITSTKQAQKTAACLIEALSYDNTNICRSTPPQIQSIPYIRRIISKSLSRIGATSHTSRPTEKGSQIMNSNQGLFCILHQRRLLREIRLLASLDQYPVLLRNEQPVSTLKHPCRVQ